MDAPWTVRRSVLLIVRGRRRRWTVAGPSFCYILILVDEECDPVEYRVNATSDESLYI